MAANVPVEQPGIDKGRFADLYRYCKEGLLEELKDALIYDKTVLDYFLVRSLKGTTLLHEAIEADQPDVIQLLLLYKVQPNVRAKGAVTPLHIAATKGHVECVRALLEGGADIKLIDDLGTDVFLKAERSRKKEAVIKLLRSRELIQLASVSGELNTLEKHLAQYRPFEPRDIEEALLVAILAGNENAIAQLVLHGARRIDCALHLAIQQERIKAIAVLLLCKATIKNDTQTIRSLLAEPPEQGGVPWYMQDVHKALSNGCISMSYPIAVSIMEEKYDATRELLLTTISMSHKTVDWAKFKLTILHPTWIYPVAPWVVTLKLHHNNLRKIPQELFSATQLRKLDLSNNSLETIQPEMLNMPSLETLNLCHNNLRELPETSVWTSTLLSLDLSHNKLQTLPSGIQHTSLEILNLSHNPLSVLPKCVCKIRTLTTINLMATSITSLPEEMKDLEHLVNLTGPGQQISELPAGILTPGLRTFAGIFKARARSSKPCYHVKAIIFCHLDVTRALILGYLKSGSPQPVSIISNFEIVHWMYRPKLAGLIPGGTRVHFNTWLMGSSQQCMSVYPCVFSPGALYLLVWDAGQTWDFREQLKPYLNQLACHVPFANILVICILPQDMSEGIADEESLNKKLLTFFQMPTYAQFIFHGLVVVPTGKDAKENFGDLKHHIYEAACKAQIRGKTVVGALYPESYYSLLLPLIEKQQEEFSKRSQPGVFEEPSLWKLIADALESDSPDMTEMPVMVAFLQDAGYLMHYEDPNDLLDQFYFLRPQWLFNTFLKFLQDSLKNGSLVVTYPDVCLHFGLGKRNALACKALVRLMTRYIIMIPVSSTEYLIPSLLPTCSPPRALSETGLLRRQFCPKAKALPADLWSRLVGLVVASCNDILAPFPDDKCVQSSDPAQAGSEDDYATPVRRKKPFSNTSVQNSSSGSNDEDDDDDDLCSLCVPHLPPSSNQSAKPVSLLGGRPEYQRSHTIHEVPFGVGVKPLDKPSSLEFLDIASIRVKTPSTTPSTDSYSPDELVEELEEDSETGTGLRRVQRWFNVPPELKKNAPIMPVRLTNQLEVWSMGVVYSHDITHDRFSLYPFVSEYTSSEERGIEVCTIRSARGRVILARLCQLVQKLLEERYPMLFSSDTTVQDQDVVQLAPCPNCLLDSHSTKKAGVHKFFVDALIHETNSLRCPHDGSDLILDELIPDYTLVDIPSEYRIKPSDLKRDDSRVIHRSHSTILYEDCSRGQTVAIKEFQGIEGKFLSQPWTSMRKEISFLLNLDHPNIIKAFGYCLHPPCVVLEKSPFGDLHDKLTNSSQKISRLVRFHIAHQVASALAYLHERCIVYRTLKARSILVWSLEFSDEISIKLANFERAEVKSHTGLLGRYKFSIHMAPEISQYNFKEEYTEKVDIYSYAFLLYELITRWSASVAGSYSASLGAKLSKELTVGYGTLVKLMKECWEPNPTLRPTANTLLDHLRQPAFQCQLTTQVLQHCLSVRGCCFVPSEKQIWVYGEFSRPEPTSDVSNLSEGTQVFVLNSENFSIQASLELTDKANAIHPVDAKVLIGMSECCVHAYDIATYTFTSRFYVDDSVTAIVNNDSFVFVALANGSVTYYTKLHMPKSPSTIKIGDKAVITMVTVSNDVWVGCGHEIVILDAESDVQLSSRIMVCDDNDQVYFLLAPPDSQVVWSLTRGKCVVTSWSASKHCKLTEIDLSVDLKQWCIGMKLDPSFLRLISLVSSNDTLWVGLTCGGIAILKATGTPQFITCLRAHERNVKCLMEVSPPERNRDDTPLVISGGYGDLSYVGTHVKDSSAIMVWQALSSAEFELLARRAL